MSHLYNKIHRCETLPCDIQNCHPAIRPIRLLDINMRYTNVDCHPKETLSTEAEFLIAAKLNKRKH